jgi:hypothetical protein
MGKTHLVIPDPHAHPDYGQERFSWLAGLIKDLKPDVVVNLGDHFDMPSLSGYDQGKKSFEGKRFNKDIEAGLEAHDRMWSPVKATKKRMPYRVALEGNHEYRLKRATNDSPHLDGILSFNVFDFDSYYDRVVEYSGGTPGVIKIDGINYAHFFVSGVMGRPISGEHPAYSLLAKRFDTCTAGHLHTTDYCVRTDVEGNKKRGLVAGVFQDYYSSWAGECNKLWWSGVIIKREVEDGNYEPQWVSINQLRKEYG